MGNESKKKKYEGPTEEERLEAYFKKLHSLIPDPGADWEKNARPCKWAKILEERKQCLENAAKKTG